MEGEFEMSDREYLLLKIKELEAKQEQINNNINMYLKLINDNLNRLNERIKIGSPTNN